MVISHKRSQCKRIRTNGCNFTAIIYPMGPRIPLVFKSVSYGTKEELCGGTPNWLSMLCILDVIVI